MPAPPDNHQNGIEIISVAHAAVIVSNELPPTPVLGVGSGLAGSILG